MELLIISGVDISHFRLIDLTRLADQAKPFYDWVEKKFQTTLNRPESLAQIIISGQSSEISRAIQACYLAADEDNRPFLFDGVGRSYSHTKACYYFFAWLIRDAPQQRLAPLIQQIIRNTGRTRTEVEVEVITALMIKYRTHVRTFSWEAIREVIIDRLEGSRRSIKGHEKEAVVRTALLIAIQAYYKAHKGYGVFTGVELSDKQITVGSESYDVSVNLLGHDDKVISRILIPIKTRETEGGGHAHLFTRDIRSAISSAKKLMAHDYLMVVIIARNWSRREIDTLESSVDHLVLFDMSPSEFLTFDTEAQTRLNTFIANVFNGLLSPMPSVKDV